MTDSDINKEALEVLQIALSKFDLNALSDASIIEGICEDRLSDYPKESTLIVTAARAGIVGLLQQQVSVVGVVDAIKLTADSLSTKFSVSNNASLWVTSQFAKVLGYDLNDPPMTNPSSAENNLNSPPFGGVITPNTLATGLVVEPTILPGQPPLDPTPKFTPTLGSIENASFDPNYKLAGPSQGNVQPSNLPLCSNSQPNPQNLVQGGYNQPVYPGSPMGPNYPTEKAGNKKNVIIPIGIVVALIVAYIVIAGVAKLPPFSKPSTTIAVNTSTTNGANSPSGSGTTTTSPGSSNQPANLSTLQSYIPQSLQQAGSCHQSSTVKSGAAVSIDCSVSTSSNIAPNDVVYFIFKSNADLYSYYNTLLTNYGVTQNKLSCSNFTTFVLNCEEEYSVGGTNRGRVTEVNYQTHPFVISTDDSQNIVVASFGPANDKGDNLVTWWGITGNWNAKL